jgi:adenylosuccinate synthase
LTGRVHIVVDLGFGDAGKGRVTDALVRRTSAALVVRFNGGAQAGHNVVTDAGAPHLSQFGSGRSFQESGRCSPEMWCSTRGR